MAEFAVAAQDLETGYRRGDVISVLDDGAIWGTDDGLPNVWIVKVPTVPLATARKVLEELTTPALPGDSALGAPDPEDRIVRRHRRRVRMFADELPQSNRDELDSAGITTLSLSEARSVYRRLRWNRNPTGGGVEDSGVGEFG